MTKVRRLAAGCACLAVLAVLGSRPWGDGGGPAGKPSLLPGDGSSPAAAPEDPEAALARTKFAAGGVVTYRPAEGKDGALFFALQLQPKLAAGPRRPRDVAVV